jgi:hypothetical protein
LDLIRKISFQTINLDRNEKEIVALKYSFWGTINQAGIRDKQKSDQNLNHPYFTGHFVNLPSPLFSKEGYKLESHLLKNSVIPWAFPL